MSTFEKLNNLNMKDDTTFQGNLDATSYVKGNFSSERIEKMVKERNKLLIKFATIIHDRMFSHLDEFEKMKYGDVPCVKLIGNCHQPTIVFRNNFVASIFVNNFKASLSTSFNTGEILRTINLNDCSLNNAEEVINEAVGGAFSETEKKYVYKVGKGLDRGYNGESFFSKFDSVGHVYYSTTNPQIFFDITDAEEVLNKLVELGVKDAYIDGVE